MVPTNYYLRPTNNWLSKDLLWHYVQILSIIFKSTCRVDIIVLSRFYLTTGKNQQIENLFQINVIMLEGPFE